MCEEQKELIKLAIEHVKENGGIIVVDGIQISYSSDYVRITAK